ncbi:transcriptional regulator, TetR family [Frankineae bacterium MT45]|nr:transcriptional regulator, TetR family [Frankineae bacterium MT45]
MIGTKGVPRPEREAQILLAAIDVFAANGYAAAAIVDIADRAGISKPLIYQYFGSKDQLYLRCLAQVSDDLIERIEETMKREDPWISSLLGTMRAIFEALEPYPSAWRLVFDPSLPTDGLLYSRARAYQARTAALAAIGTERFLRARGNRSSLDASALTSAWINIIHALITWWIDHPRESADAMIQRCSRLLNAIVSPEIA